MPMEDGKPLPLGNSYIVRPVIASNRGLAAKDILLDLARRCFWQLGYEVNFLRALEARQMITSVIAHLGFRRDRRRDEQRARGSASPRHHDGVNLSNVSRL